MTPLLPIGLNLDQSLARQDRLRARLETIADLDGAGDALRLSATEAAAARARAQLAQLRADMPGRWLTFIGSGDFHHVALLLLETLPAEVRPFTLVVIDNHPDWFLESPRFHCGNWVSGALALAGVQEVVLIGQDSPDLVWYRFYRSPFEALCEGRLTLHPLRLRRKRVPLRWPAAPERPERFRRRPWGTELRFQSVRDDAGLFGAIAARLRGRNVYLSVDKDCLVTGQAVTDWEQGGLTLHELLEGVRELGKNCDIIGADICGERAPGPLRGLLKRLDAGRFRNRLLDPDADARINEPVNLALLEAFGVVSAEVVACR